MSVIHEKSSIQPLQEFDIFLVPPTQLSVQRTYDIIYRPLAPPTSDSPIDFQIRTSEYHYAVPSEFLLKLELKIGLVKKTDGSKGNISFHTTSEFKPVQNLLSSIFKNVEFTIGGKTLKLQANTYPYRAFLENLLGYDGRAKKTHLRLAGWFEKETDRDAFLIPISNNEFKTITLIGRIHTDLTHQTRALLGGSRIDIKLEPHEPSWYTMHNSTTHVASAEFLKAELIVKFLEVTDLLKTAHNVALNRGTAKYATTSVDIRHFTISANKSDDVITSVITGNLPRRSYIFFVRNTSFNGAPAEDPFKFDDFRLKSLALEVDGISFPIQPMECDFDKNKYEMVYLNFFRNLNQNTNEPFINTTYEEFKSLPIFVIQFCPDLSSSCGAGGHVSPIHTNQHINLKLAFHTPLSQVTNVFLYSEYDEILEFDVERNAVAAING